jgi:hypothetical protein
MKANELRIGNLLNHNNGSMVGSFIVGLIHLEDIIKENSHAREYEPIPLTEEWLIRMGFEKSYFENIPYFEKRCLTIDGCFFDVELMDGSKLELKSVHQLQNLYFALTNEELTMK